MTPAEFFAKYASRIDKSGDCWLWTSHLNNKGYGYIDEYGRGDGTRRRFLVHRLVMRSPVKTEVRHKCHHPSCVNPAHLELGTHAENMRDMVLAGRTRSKISPAHAVIIRDAVTAGAPVAAMARLAGTTPKVINRIVRRQTFAAVTHGPVHNRGRGEHQPQAKLTDDLVRQIRRRASAGDRQIDIARDLAITPQAINHIVKRKAWRHVE